MEDTEKRSYEPGSILVGYNDYEKVTFLFNGRVNGDGYGIVISMDSGGNLLRCSDWNNYCWGGKVRPADRKEMDRFFQAVMYHRGEIKYY